MTKETSLSLIVCDWAIKCSIYLAIFLVPLFFLPWTSDILDFNKQLVLSLLVTVAFIFWIIKTLISGKFEFNKSKTHIFVGVFFLIYVLSTAFSTYKYGSFWGWPQITSESLLSLMAVISLYFIVSNIFSKKEVFISVIVLTCSALVAEIVGLLQLAGIYILFSETTKSLSFNTIGSVGALGFFAVVLIPVSMLLVMVSRKWWRFLFAAQLVVSLILFSFINYSIIWWSVIIASALVMIFGAIKRDVIESRWMVLPMFFLAVSVFFMLLGGQIGWMKQKTNEVFLSQQTSLRISFQAIKENPILGSGPGTFVYNFSKFKDASLSQSSLWAITFNEATSEVLNKLATIGILGMLAFLALIIFTILRIAKILIKDKEEDSDLLLLGLSLGFVTLCFIYFLYCSNLVLDLLFYLLLAGIVVIISKERKAYELKSSSLATLGITFAFTLILIFGLGIVILNGQRYVAELNYHQALVKWSEGNIDEATKKLEAAASLNSSSDLYFRQLSQVYLSQLLKNAQDLTSTPTQEESTLMQNLVANSVNAAKISTDLNPNSTSNWSARGYVYQNLFGILDDAGTWALNSYDQALKLDPNSPYFYFQEGNVNYILAVRTETTDRSKKIEYLNKAKEMLEKSINLNTNYSNALYSLGVVYDALGEKTKAIESFTKVQQLNPDNKDIPQILTNLKAGRSISSITTLPTETPAEDSSLDKTKNTEENSDEE
jgi:tetratricopeptide (TPR) repeat protein